MKGYEFQSDFAKKYIALGRDQGLDVGRKEGRTEGRKEGRTAGRKEGRTEGRREGRKEGRKEGETALLLRLLRARFGELPAAAVARVEGAEIAQLERWGERVLTAGTLAEVLAEAS